ncbi:MAG TPA: endolytic transglycosylase MltG [Vicinamibacterales bacterium]
MGTLRWMVLVLVVLAAVAAGAVYVSLQRVAEPFEGYEGVEQFVDILPGDGTPAITRKLVDAGVVRDRWTFRVALWRTGAARRLQAGEYRFQRAMTALDVVSMLARGDIYLRAVTFPEGLTVREMSRIFESRGLGTAAAFVGAAKDHVALVDDIDPDARDLEGYLFPETYTLSRHAGAVDLVRMMVARFHQVFTPELRDLARAHGLTPRQAVTLASLVEKETAKPGERPVVAGVYLRRLNVGMPLQCDPTVIYALEMRNQYRGDLTHENLLVDSPYNTYRYRGLPPGPIAAPSRTSIEAVAHAEPVDYLYFVSRNDGSHVFARTLDEHNRNVRKYQVDYFRQRRGQGQSGR